MQIDKLKEMDLASMNIEVRGKGSLRFSVTLMVRGVSVRVGEDDEEGEGGGRGDPVEP